MGSTNQFKVTTKLLNCRQNPSMSAVILDVAKMGEIYNVVAMQNGWGQLENGLWINLEFTVPYKETVDTPTDFVTGTSEVGSAEPAEVIASVSKGQMDTYPVHKVKKKESLWDIAEFWYGAGYGHRYVEIKEFNNLKSDILRAGMVLKIPNISV